jgi:diguanylate cyclase (GGDEF)-like protein
MLARIGGEEFGLLLPGAGPEEAVATAERFRESIASMEIVELVVRASAGVCADVDQSMNAETLYSKADRALYEAKRSGRNRTHLHIEDPTID